MRKTEFVWQNGILKKWDQATVHVLAHGLHYGSTVFEGIRCYETPDGPAIFRLKEHITRLVDSCRMYRVKLPCSSEDISAACLEVIRRNDLTNAYIRPIVYCDVSTLGLAPPEDGPVGVAVCAFEWEPLFGKEANEKGSHICVSSWTRLQSSTNPVMAKAGGHYLTSQLIAQEAKLNGYDEGIAVNPAGLITEGAGSNLFLIKDGTLLTPPLGASILAGVTRDSVKRIALDEDNKVVEANLPREALYAADELFLCGTAAELTPVVSVDRISIADGRPGPITRRLQQCYSDAVAGRSPQYESWLARVKSC